MYKENNKGPSRHCSFFFFFFFCCCCFFVCLFFCCFFFCFVFCLFVCCCCFFFRNKPQCLCLSEIQTCSVLHVSVCFYFNLTTSHFVSPHLLLSTNESFQYTHKTHLLCACNILTTTSNLLIFIILEHRLIITHGPCVIIRLRLEKKEEEKQQHLFVAKHSLNFQVHI